MSSLETVCQECGGVLREDEGVKVTSEGWVCDACCEQWRKGNDVY